MVLVDTNSSADILYLDTFKKIVYSMDNLKKVQISLVRFTRDTLYSEGVIEMRVEFGQSPPFTSTMVEFLMVDTSSTYNAILEKKNSKYNWGWQTH
jgi:ubiquitin-protein ligase